MKYITYNVKYPASAAKRGAQGNVVCRFVVGEDGSVSNVEVLKSVDPDLDAEAIRVILSLPKFTPGEQRGVAVPVMYCVPVRFKLETNVNVADSIAQ